MTLYNSARGPSAPGSKIDNPRHLDPFAFDQGRPADGDAQAGIEAGQPPLDSPADFLVEAAIEIEGRQRSDDQREGDAPLEDEPTEVDQASDDGRQPSVADDVLESIPFATPPITPAASTINPSIAGWR